MNRNKDNRLGRFLEGYSLPDQMQEPQGRPGDPQLAALNQYLQTKHFLSQQDIIVDFGSGKGVLANVMASVWAGKASCPWYYAVDREPIIDSLAVPTIIHNHSKKLASDNFLDNGLGDDQSRVKIVVLRNVLHELDILTTAKVLYRLRQCSGDDIELYIQDIVNLPSGERARVGWHPDLLANVLMIVGFNCTSPVALDSKSGTQWFTIIGRKNLKHFANQETIERSVASSRTTQRERIIEKLNALSATSDEATTTQYVILQTEEAAISTQLQQYSYFISQRTRITPSYVVAGGVPLVKIPDTKLEFLEEYPKTDSRSGLVAILSSKNLIDIPALIRTSETRAYFAGYSQRSLFQSQPTQAAIIESHKKGVDFKVLLVHPDSEATRARSQSLAYSEPLNLVQDILSTRSAYKEFKKSVPVLQKGSNLSLRLTSFIPPCSFFIIDDLCFVSLYSIRLSGGSGPCLVFKNDPSEPNAYFAVLLQEFHLIWDRASTDE